MANGSFATLNITRTERTLNSRTAKDSQGLVRMPLLALPVLENPGDTLPRTGTRNNPKPNQGL